MKLPGTIRRLLVAAVAMLVPCALAGCPAGSIDAQDEPGDAGEEAVEPDGSDGDPADPGPGDPEDAGKSDDGGIAEDGMQEDADPTGDGDSRPDDGPGPVSEFLLFDGSGRQFTWDESGFHVLINPGDPLPVENWLEPVDYYEGEFHVRYVVEAPPDQQPGKLQTCIWTMGDDGVGGNYFPESCGQQVTHAGPGTYVVTSSLAPSSWWKLDGVPLDYAHPERFLIRVVLRGESGCNVTRYDVSGACWDLWPLYENMIFRVTIVMVGAGETFSGWVNYP